MKKFIIFSICIQFTFSQVASAGKYYNNAVKIIAQQQLQLESKVQSLLMADVNSLAARMFIESKSLRDSLDQMKTLDKTIAELALGFKKINQLDTNKVAALTKQVMKEIKNFSELNRDYFSLSFLPSTLERQKGGFIKLFERFVESYDYMCTKGRNDITWIDQIPPNLEPDKLQYNLYFELGNINDNVAKYKQYNYSHPDWEHVSTAATSTFAISGTVASTKAWNAFNMGNSASAAVGAWGTVAVAAVAVVVVAAVVNYLEGISKRNRIMKDMYNAKKHTLTYGISSEDISQRYIEKCKHLSSVFKQTVPKLRALDGLSPQEIMSQFGDFKSQENLINNNLKKLNKISMKRFNLQMYEEGHCVNKYKSNDSSSCQYTEDTLYCAQDRCEIKNFNNINLDELIKQEDELFKNVTTESLSLTMDGIVKLITVDFPKTVESYSSDAFIKVQESRLSALYKLIQILKIKESIPNQKFEEESALFKQYTKRHVEFMDLLNKTIKYIFGTGAYEELLESFVQYKKEFKVFYRRYNHVGEVVSLKKSLDRLEKFLED